MATFALRLVVLNEGAYVAAAYYETTAEHQGGKKALVVRHYPYEVRVRGLG